MTLLTGKNSDRVRTGRPFTLIELVCVLVLLATLMGLAAPALAPFFHSRSVTDEARRFLALTGYARSQAVARGWPVRLWIETQNGRYGLEPLPGFQAEAGKTVEFKVLPDGVLTVEAGPRPPDERVTILFLPDGTIGADSVQNLTLFARKDEANAIRITRAADDPRYVVAP